MEQHINNIKNESRKVRSNRETLDNKWNWHWKFYYFEKSNFVLTVNKLTKHLNLNKVHVSDIY